MSEPDVIPAPRRRGRPWFVGCAGAVVALLVLLAGQYGYLRYQASRRLREVTDALDREDPRWRLADIEEDREQIPDAENAALVVLAVRAMLPPQGVLPADLEIPGKGVEPPHRLRGPTAERLRAELEKVTAAVEKARTLADLDRGRYPIAYTPDPMSTLLESQEARGVAWLLSADAADHGERGDMDGALRSACAALVCARSVGDEPFTISQLIRIACAATAANAVERALNQGEAGDAELATVQAAWRKEDRADLTRVAVRGERGAVNETAGQLYSGKAVTGTLAGRLMLLGNASWLRDEHAQVLKAMTRWVEIAELPPHEQFDQIDTVQKEVEALPRSVIMAKLLMPAVAKGAQATYRHRAAVRSLIVLVAAERYRKANGRWPESVAALVPAYFPEVPLDPYDGKPIRLRRTPVGVTVYSVGPDRKDDGGRINREKPSEAGTDWGYQLWDVDRRRQPAPPADVPEP